jgi:hypothetical protein
MQIVLPPLPPKNVESIEKSFCCLQGHFTHPTGEEIPFNFLILHMSVRLSAKGKGWRRIRQ